MPPKSFGSGELDSTGNAIEEDVASTEVFFVLLGLSQAKTTNHVGRQFIRSGKLVPANFLCFIMNSSTGILSMCCLLITNVVCLVAVEDKKIGMGGGINLFTGFEFTQRTCGVEPAPEFRYGGLESPLVLLLPEIQLMPIHLLRGVGGVHVH